MNPEHKFTTISLTSGTIVRSILFVGFFAALYYIKDLVLVVLAAVVIASSIEPATLWFAKYRVKRVPAVILVYVVIIALLFGFFIFFLPSVLNEALVYLNNLPSNINVNDLWNPIRETGLVSVNPSQQLQIQSFSIKDLIDNFRDVLSGTSEGAFKTFNVFFGGALSFILMVVLSFYLSVQEDGVANFLRVITPVKSHEYIVDLWKRSQRKIGFWMQGQLLLGVIVGVLVYLGLTVLGIKHALLLATLAAFFEIIPVFGPILSAIPAIIVAMVDGGLPLAAIVLGLYVVIHQFENHLLYPLVVKKIVGVSPIVVILALVIGAKLAGFLGAVLAVPLAAALMEYVNDVEKSKMHTHHS